MRLNIITTDNCVVSFDGEFCEPCKYFKIETHPIGEYEMDFVTCIINKNPITCDCRILKD